MLPRRALLDNELNSLNQAVLSLSSMVDKAIGDSVDALMNNNILLAEEVIAGDAEINRLRFHIEEMAYVILSTQQPLARDLRTVIAAIHFAIELERIGDHAAGIARIVTRMEDIPRPINIQAAPDSAVSLEAVSLETASPEAASLEIISPKTPHVSPETPQATAEPSADDETEELPEGEAPTLRLKLSRLPKMTKRARDMLRRAIEGYIERDVNKANAIVKRDRKLDRQYRKFFAEAMAEMNTQHVAEMPTYLLWIAHNLERIGDRTTNLAERVIFMVTGQYTEVLEDYE